MLLRNFYSRDAATAAHELLGKVLVRRSKEGATSGKIVETEAYYGKGDPASRASRKRTAKNEIMWGPGGFAFIYMVHGHWLFNVTTGRKGIPGVVLIRALKPIEGLNLMKRRRKINDPLELTSGPGKLTRALGITGEHHGMDLTKTKELFISEGEDQKFKIGSSHRIGVNADLKRKLRFFILGNQYVSR